MRFDALLKGTGPDGLDIGIRDGLVTAIGRYLSSDRLCPVYDLRGKFVLPGIVDLWAAPNSGREALLGGVTLQCIHLDNALPLGESLRAAKEQEAKNPLDHCFAFRVRGEIPTKEALQVARTLGLAAVSFSLHAFSDSEAALILENAASANVAALCVLDHPDFRRDASPPARFLRAPIATPTPAGEMLMATRAIALAEACELPVELVGVTQAEILRRVRQAQKRGVKVHAHVFAHNLLAHRGVYLRRHGAWLHPAPPLRAKKDAKALWAALGRSGVIVASAERPHGALSVLDEAHANPFAGAAARALLYRAQRRQKFSLDRWAARFSLEPLRVLGFGKERAPVAIGALADLCVFDPQAREVIGPRRPKTADEWEPFAGHRALPPPVLVMQRGRVLLDDKGPREEKGEIARPM